MMRNYTLIRFWPLVGSVIREKFNYSFKFFSIPSNITEFTKIADETSKWSALDLVVIYFAPDGKKARNQSQECR